MANIKSLPIEILDLIFRHTIPPFYVSPLPKCLPNPSRALFPFNVASVCSLWLRILKASPRYWKLIAIDVADDPTSFLDFFALRLDNTDTFIDVIVFSSLKDVAHDPNDKEADDLRKRRENSRACSVFKHLQPALSRCRSITYDLVYQSSLPSAAVILTDNVPVLSELSLACIIHDFDDHDEEIEIDEEKLPPTVDTTSPMLEKLSLTGFAFMEFYQVGQYWLSKLGASGDGNAKFKLAINHFKFQKRSAQRFNGSRTFTTFMDALENMGDMIVDLSLSDLSLDYRPSTTTSAFCDLFLEKLSFDNVSSGFLSAFFAVVDFPNGEANFLSFKGCKIPSIGSDMGLAESADLRLELVDIPFPPSNSFHCAHPLHLPDESIYNALEAFPPKTLRLLRCDGITNTCIDWFSGDRYDGVEIPMLETLTIHDCAGFTSGGVRSFINNRAERWISSDNDVVSALRRVEVYGKVPLLSKDDGAWLLERCGRKDLTYVSWNAAWEGEFDQDRFITDLRPAIEEEIWDRL